MRLRPEFLDVIRKFALHFVLFWTAQEPVRSISFRFGAYRNLRASFRFVLESAGTYRLHFVLFCSVQEPVRFISFRFGPRRNLQAPFRFVLERTGSYSGQNGPL